MFSNMNWTRNSNKFCTLRSGSGLTLVSANVCVVSFYVTTSLNVKSFMKPSLSSLNFSNCSTHFLFKKLDSISCIVMNKSCLFANVMKLLRFCIKQPVHLQSYARDGPKTVQN